VTVVAFSTPAVRDWRWRIVDYAGDTIAESDQTFGTIAAAVTAGERHLGSMNVIDRSVRRSPYQSASSRRR
jgi:hypothetical protein